MRTLLLVTLLEGCVVRAPAYRHIYVPNQPESAKCWRECRAIEATCNNRPPPTNTRWINLDDVCEEQRKDCLMSCPGAVVEWRDRDGRPSTRDGRPLQPAPNDDGG